jgi:2-polyprenyl-3-methyl-5-hydroxy-6-metoxy-1,4-benzoquinol methylase
VSEARCWCGDSELVPFAPDYARCTSCETLVCTMAPVESTAGVVDDKVDFYGERYWTGHQTEWFGFPPIEERARADLPERCLHWLGTLLRYRLPPARLLDLGAAHGAFVRLAAVAGFDALGIEMSPTVVELARRTFGIDMRVGPLESAGVADDSFDVIASFDVLEHLRDPEATLRAVRRALRPDGLLIMQTPDFPARSAEELRAGNDLFLAHLQPPEHLFLFSKTAAGEMLRRTGFPRVAFETPLYSYDMFFVAATELPEPAAADAVTAALLSTPDGRIVQALFDVAAERDEYRSAAAQRLAVIDDLKRACDERLAVIESLDQALRERG